MASAQDDPSLDGLTLSVHPSVVFRLGEEMIQDDVQALVGFAKNAYDADSPTARISVDTHVATWPDGQEVVDADADEAGLLRGSISVVDRGTGMTSEQITQAWLTVSGSPNVISPAQRHDRQRPNAGRRQGAWPAWHAAAWPRR